ncbi:MAG: type II toxin-antitoxin system HicA family toxin [Tannerellaceae bacterium]|jgi:predicted RNA binding protein YcfA (HicA-like mRNA interferase family)|nr:type II toxin-antitoxin system HicA family toxin [Tannerellaceae bacterium]
MKYKEFHRIIIRQGWMKVRQSGSHVVYEKNGRKIPVPYHGSKEFPEGLRLKLMQEMGL